MRECAHYFRFFRGERENHELAGGETVIRTPRAPFADQDAQDLRPNRSPLPAFVLKHS
jgi:hypothetical protein